MRSIFTNVLLLIAVVFVGNLTEQTFQEALGQSVSTLGRSYSIPVVDLAGEKSRQTIIDKEQGQYLGHPTTVLLEDRKTIIAVYPKGHGRGAIVMKKSTDGGIIWSDRLKVPDNWSTSQEVPTIYRVVDAAGSKRLILFSGLYPIRMAVSEDDGESWTPLSAIGDFGGIVAMADLVEIAPGRYMALFHDDGRFIKKGGVAKELRKFNVYKTISNDGGLTWGTLEVIATHDSAHLCEPGAVRSPDGKQIAVLLRENSRRHNSFAIFSNDQGTTWTKPKELPAALTGDRHVCRYTADGRLIISFRDTTLESPTKGDWVLWVGNYQDIVQGRQGQYRVRLMDNHRGADCAYPTIEVLPDDTFLATTYGHWSPGESPYIASVRFKMDELDAKAKKLTASLKSPSENHVFTKGERGYHTFRIPALIATKKGTLLAFCEGRKDNRRDHGDIDLVLKRSDDNGKTWGPLELVYEEGGTSKITIGNPCPVVDQDTGVIWLPFNKDNNEVMITSSDDDGNTWKKPRRITDDVKKQDWDWYAMGPGNGIQLTRGRYRGRLVIPCDHRVKNSGSWDRAGRSHIIYSDDHGKTWQLGGVTDFAMNECAVVELTDGTLMLNMRSYRGRGRRATALSKDGGITWSSSKDVSALIEPVCQASFLRYTDGKDDGKTRLLFSNPANSRGRDHLTVRLSYDEGRTWPVGRLIYKGLAAYSSLVVLPDRNIGMLYEKNGYQTITFASFDLPWLTNGVDRLR